MPTTILTLKELTDFAKTHIVPVSLGQDSASYEEIKWPLTLVFKEVDDGLIFDLKMKVKRYTTLGASPDDERPYPIRVPYTFFNSLIPPMWVEKANAECVTEPVLERLIIALFDLEHKSLVLTSELLEFRRKIAEKYFKNEDVVEKLRATRSTLAQELLASSVRSSQWVCGRLLLEHADLFVPGQTIEGAAKASLLCDLLASASDTAAHDTPIADFVFQCFSDELYKTHGQVPHWRQSVFSQLFDHPQQFSSVFARHLAMMLSGESWEHAPAWHACLLPGGGISERCAVFYLASLSKALATSQGIHALPADMVSDMERALVVLPTVPAATDDSMIQALRPSLSLQRIQELLGYCDVQAIPETSRAGLLTCWMQDATTKNTLLAAFFNDKGAYALDWLAEITPSSKMDEAWLDSLLVNYIQEKYAVQAEGAKDYAAILSEIPPAPSFPVFQRILSFVRRAGQFGTRDSQGRIITYSIPFPGLLQDAFLKKFSPNYLVTAIEANAVTLGGGGIEEHMFDQNMFLNPDPDFFIYSLLKPLLTSTIRHNDYSRAQQLFQLCSSNLKGPDFWAEILKQVKEQTEAIPSSEFVLMNPALLDLIHLGMRNESVEMRPDILPILASLLIDCESQILRELNAATETATLMDDILKYKDIGQMVVNKSIEQGFFGFLNWLTAEQLKQYAQNSQPNVFVELAKKDKPVVEIESVAALISLMQPRTEDVTTCIKKQLLQPRQEGEESVLSMAIEAGLLHRSDLVILCGLNNVLNGSMITAQALKALVEQNPSLGTRYEELLSNASLEYRCEFAQQLLADETFNPLQHAEFFQLLLDELPAIGKRPYVEDVFLKALAHTLVLDFVKNQKSTQYQKLMQHSVLTALMKAKAMCFDKFIQASIAAIIGVDFHAASPSEIAIEHSVAQAEQILRNTEEDPLPEVDTPQVMVIGADTLQDRPLIFRHREVKTTRYALPNEGGLTKKEITIFDCTEGGARIADSECTTSMDIYLDKTYTLMINEQGFASLLYKYDDMSLTIQFGRRLLNREKLSVTDFPQALFFDKEAAFSDTVVLCRQLDPQGQVLKQWEYAYRRIDNASVWLVDAVAEVKEQVAWIKTALSFETMTEQLALFTSVICDSVEYDAMNRPLQRVRLVLAQPFIALKTPKRSVEVYQYENDVLSNTDFFIGMGFDHCALERVTPKKAPDATPDINQTPKTKALKHEQGVWFNKQTINAEQSIFKYVAVNQEEQVLAEWISHEKNETARVFNEFRVFYYTPLLEGVSYLSRVLAVPAAALSADSSMDENTCLAALLDLRNTRAKQTTCLQHDYHLRVSPYTERSILRHVFKTPSDTQAGYVWCEESFVIDTSGEVIAYRDPTGERFSVVSGTNQMVPAHSTSYQWDAAHKDNLIASPIQPPMLFLPTGYDVSLANFIQPAQAVRVMMCALRAHLQRIPQLPEDRKKAHDKLDEVTQQVIQFTNANNRLISVEYEQGRIKAMGDTSYAYYANGLLKQATKGPEGKQITTTYTYDARQQLIQTVETLSDGTQNTTAIHYNLQQQIIQYRDGNGCNAYHYFYDDQGMPLVIVAESSNPDLAADGHPALYIVEWMRYDAHGLLTRVEASWFHDEHRLPEAAILERVNGCEKRCCTQYADYRGLVDAVEPRVTTVTYLKKDIYKVSTVYFDPEPASTAEQKAVMNLLARVKRIENKYCDMRDRLLEQHSQGELDMGTVTTEQLPPLEDVTFTYAATALSTMRVVGKYVEKPLDKIYSFNTPTPGCAPEITFETGGHVYVLKQTVKSCEEIIVECKQPDSHTYGLLRLPENFKRNFNGYNEQKLPAILGHQPGLGQRHNKTYVTCADEAYYVEITDSDVTKTKLEFQSQQDRDTFNALFSSDWDGTWKTFQYTTAAPEHLKTIRKLTNHFPGVGITTTFTDTGEEITQNWHFDKELLGSDFKGSWRTEAELGIGASLLAIGTLLSEIGIGVPIAIAGAGMMTSAVATNVLAQLSFYITEGGDAKITCALDSDGYIREVTMHGEAGDPKTDRVQVYERNTYHQLVAMTTLSGEHKGEGLRYWQVAGQSVLTRVALPIGILEDSINYAQPEASGFPGTNALQVMRQFSALNRAKQGDWVPRVGGFQHQSDMQMLEEAPPLTQTSIDTFWAPLILGSITIATFMAALPSGAALTYLEDEAILMGLAKMAGNASFAAIKGGAMGASIEYHRQNYSLTRALQSEISLRQITQAAAGFAIAEAGGAVFDGLIEVLGSTAYVTRLKEYMEGSAEAGQAFTALTPAIATQIFARSLLTPALFQTSDILFFDEQWDTKSLLTMLLIDWSCRYNKNFLGGQLVKELHPSLVVIEAGLANVLVQCLVKSTQGPISWNTIDSTWLAFTVMGEAHAAFHNKTTVRYKKIVRDAISEHVRNREYTKIIERMDIEPFSVIETKDVMLMIEQSVPFPDARPQRQTFEFNQAVYCRLETRDAFDLDGFLEAHGKAINAAKTDFIHAVRAQLLKGEYSRAFQEIVQRDSPDYLKLCDGPKIHQRMVDDLADLKKRPVVLKILACLVRRNDLNWVSDGDRGAGVWSPHESIGDLNMLKILDAAVETLQSSANPRYCEDASLLRAVLLPRFTENNQALAIIVEDSPEALIRDKTKTLIQRLLRILPQTTDIEARRQILAALCSRQGYLFEEIGSDVLRTNHNVRALLDNSRGMPDIQAALVLGLYQNPGVNLPEEVVSLPSNASISMEAWEIIFENWSPEHKDILYEAHFAQCKTTRFDFSSQATTAFARRYKQWPHTCTEQLLIINEPERLMAQLYPLIGKKTLRSQLQKEGLVQLIKPLIDRTYVRDCAGFKEVIQKALENDDHDLMDMMIPTLSLSHVTTILSDVENRYGNDDVYQKIRGLLASHRGNHLFVHSKSQEAREARLMVLSHQPPDAELDLEIESQLVLDLEIKSQLAYDTMLERLKVLKWLPSVVAQAFLSASEFDRHRILIELASVPDAQHRRICYLQCFAWLDAADKTARVGQYFVFEAGEILGTLVNDESSQIIKMNEAEFKTISDQTSRVSPLLMETQQVLSHIKGNKFSEIVELLGKSTTITVIHVCHFIEDNYKIAVQESKIRHLILALALSIKASTDYAHTLPLLEVSRQLLSQGNPDHNMAYLVPMRSYLLQLLSSAKSRPIVLRMLATLAIDDGLRCFIENSSEFNIEQHKRVRSVLLAMSAPSEPLNSAEQSERAVLLKALRPYVTRVFRDFSRDITGNLINYFDTWYAHDINLDFLVEPIRDLGDDLLTMRFVYLRGSQQMTCPRSAEFENRYPEFLLAIEKKDIHEIARIAKGMIDDTSHEFVLMIQENDYLAVRQAARGGHQSVMPYLVALDPQKLIQYQLTPTLINHHEFLKAVEYVSEHHFNTPYSITPMADRWFSQLAMIEMEDGVMINLSGETAQQYMDISIDDHIFLKEQIDLVMKFHADHLKAKLLGEERSLGDEKSLAFDESKWIEFNRCKKQAKVWYDQIVEKGKSTLNTARLELNTGSKMKAIIYRPNHGLTHSVRVSYFITTLHAYAKEHGVENMNLTEAHLETLQTMMLFSVVGRQDETGFKDTSGSNRFALATYQKFRATSGKEYLKYAKEYRKNQYDDSIETIYRDAIVVELMGYQNIEEVIFSREEPIEIFIDYVIAKRQNRVNREEALVLIQGGDYTLNELFPLGEVRTLADSQLALTELAHAIDLIRCYPLGLSTSTFDCFLNRAHFYDFTDDPDPTKLESFYALMRYVFDTLACTGQKTMFGLLSTEEFKAQREDCLKKVKHIADACKNNPNLNRNAEIGKVIIQCLTADGDKRKALPYDRSMFDFQHSVGLQEGSYRIDHHQNALKLINSLHTLNPISGVMNSDKLPIISRVEQDSTQDKVTLFFDDAKQMTHFMTTYALFFKEEPVHNDQAVHSVIVTKAHYKQLLQDQLIQFKQVEVPKAIQREALLIEDNGRVDAINLITNHKALGRLVSTMALNGENHPDYQYLFRALEDPVHERYPVKAKTYLSRPIDRRQYSDPRNGRVYQRMLADTFEPELRFQEPIVKPSRFSDKTGAEWRLGLRGRAKNTIYTKKMAHSLLHPNAGIAPFLGQLDRQSKYFPIGVLSTIDQIDLKSERYIWPRNMVTANQVWIRDSSKVQEAIETLFQQLTTSSPDDSASLLVDHLRTTCERITTKLDNAYYRPTDANLTQLRELLRAEYKACSLRLKNDPKECQMMQAIYKTLASRIKAERENPKYAISIAALRQQDSGVDYNELLVSNTKGAVRALYTSQVSLFYRLNLALHALKIKAQYHYDVPLLVPSNDKPPLQHYTEALIEADLRAAYQALCVDTFPYDESLFPVYAYDELGKLKRTAKGGPVTQKNELGQETSVPKNLDYQRNTLIELFQLGAPELTKLEQLRDSIEEDIVLSIVKKMNVLGGLQREEKLMKDVFSGNDPTAKEKFFLRTASLGHLLLMQKILVQEGFSVSDNLLDKGIQFAINNVHPALVDYLRTKKTNHPAPVQTTTLRQHSIFLEPVLPVGDGADLIALEL